MEEVFTYLESLHISYINHNHPAVYTVEEARKYREGINGRHCKNLFLEDSKRNQFYLLIAPADKSIRLNKIRKQIKAKKLSFASEDKLQEILGLDAGSVSIFGLINDQENQTILLLDSDLWNVDRITFHPNTNTMTLEISGDDFHKLVESFDNDHIIFDITSDNS